MGVFIQEEQSSPKTIQQALGVSWLAGQGIRTYIQPSAELVALNYHCLGTVNGSMTVNVSRCCFLTKNIRMSLHTYTHTHSIIGGVPGQWCVAGVLKSIETQRDTARYSRSLGNPAFYAASLFPRTDLGTG